MVLCIYVWCIKHLFSLFFLFLAYFFFYYLLALPVSSSFVMHILSLSLQPFFTFFSFNYCSILFLSLTFLPFFTLSLSPTTSLFYIFLSKGEKPRRYNAHFLNIFLPLSHTNTVQYLVIWYSFFRCVPGVGGGDNIPQRLQDQTRPGESL